MNPNLVDLIKEWLFESCLFIHWQAIYEDTKVNFNGARSIGYFTSDCAPRYCDVTIHDDKVIIRNLLGEPNEVYHASDPEFFNKLGSKLKFIHNDRCDNCTMLL